MLDSTHVSTYSATRAAAMSEGTCLKVDEASEVGQVIQQVNLLAAVSATLDDEELIDLSCYVHCARAVQTELLAAFLQEHGGGGILLQYSQDTTPLKTRRSFSKKQFPVATQKVAKITTDLLVQHVYVSSPSGGQMVHKLFYGPPIPMMHGKATKALAAFVHSCPGALAIPASLTNYRLRHIIVDRGVPHDVGRYLSGLWAGNLASSLDADNVDDPEYSEMAHYELHTMLHCAAHDCHNSLKWSQPAFHEDPQFLSDAFVALAARRGCASACIQGISSWLSRVEFVATDHAPEYSHEDMLWATVSVDVSSAAVFSKYKLRWNGQRLQMLEPAHDDDVWLREVSSALLEVWRHVPFTASRWCTLGESARCYIIGALTGFESLCQWLLREGKLGEFDRNGLSKLTSTQRLQEFLVVTGLTGFLPEGMLASLLEDPRLAMQQDKLWHDVCEEHMQLQALPMEVWSLLQPACPKLCPKQLQHVVLHSSLRSLAFLQYRIFRVASSLPWSLCQLQPSDAIDKLRVLPWNHVDDPVTGKLKAHLEIGECAAKVTGALRLLCECSWTSHQSERQHASGAQIRKHHAEIGLETTVLRAFTHGLRQQLPVHGAPSSRADRLRAKMRVFLRKSPGRVGARNMFFRDIVEKMRLANANRAHGTPAHSQLMVMKIHVKNWDKLSGAARARFEREANIRKSAAAQKWAEDFQALEAELDLELLREQQEHKAADALGVRVSATRWPPWAVERLAVLLGELKSRSSLNLRVREDALRCPQPVAEAPFQRACQLSMLPARPGAPLSEAYRAICRLRKHFETAIFAAPEHGHLSWLRLGFCVASPCEMFCFPLHLLEPSSPTSCAGPKDWAEAAVAATEAEWMLEPSLQVRNDDWLGGRDLMDIVVHMDSQCCGDGIVRSRSTACPLGPVLDSLMSELGVERQVGEVTAERSSRASDSKQRNDTASSSSIAVPAGSADASAPPASEMELIDQAVRDAEARYEEIAAAGGEVEGDARDAELEDDADFRVSVLGGLWQVQRTGRSVYGLRVDCRAKSATYNMAVSLGFPRSASFEYNKYGETTAAVLVDVYKHKMAFLRKIWQRQGGKGRPASSEVASYALPQELQQKLSDCNAAARKRVEQYRQLGS